MKSDIVVYLEQLLETLQHAKKHLNKEIHISESSMKVTCNWDQYDNCYNLYFGLWNDKENIRRGVTLKIREEDLKQVQEGERYPDFWVKPQKGKNQEEEKRIYEFL